MSGREEEEETSFPLTQSDNKKISDMTILYIILKVLQVMKPSNEPPFPSKTLRLMHS